MSAAATAMRSGVPETGRAAAAGIISMAVMSNAPTTLIETGDEHRDCYGQDELLALRGRCRHRAPVQG